MDPHGTHQTGHPAPNGAPPASGPTILTRSRLKEANRKRNTEGLLFPLEMTGGYARIKVPSLVDRAFLDQLPNSLQKIISDQLANENVKVRKDKQEELAAMTGEEQLQHYKDLISAQDELAKRAMVYCWITPKVVLDEADINPIDDNVVLADDVHIEDRIAFVNLIFVGEKEAARQLAEFHKRPLEPVSPQPRLEAVPAPESPAEHAESAFTERLP